MAKAAKRYRAKGTVIYGKGVTAAPGEFLKNASPTEVTELLAAGAIEVIGEPEAVEPEVPESKADDLE